MSLVSQCYIITSGMCSGRPVGVWSSMKALCMSEHSLPLFFLDDHYQRCGRESATGHVTCVRFMLMSKGTAFTWQSQIGFHTKAKMWLSVVAPSLPIWKLSNEPGIDHVAFVNKVHQPAWSFWCLGLCGYAGLLHISIISWSWMKMLLYSFSQNSSACCIMHNRSEFSIS